MKLNEKLTNVDYSNDHVVSDANNAIETGGYYTNASTANLPVSGSSGYLDVKYHSDTQLVQTWTRYRDNQIFIRQYNTVEPSGWKDWQEFGPKSAITVMCTSNQTYTSNSYQVANAYNSIINQIGSNIEMTSNGQFQVQKDMNVLLSFYNNIQPYVANQLIMYKISINNEEPYQQQAFECGTQWGNSGQSISNFLLKLKKNDTVALKIYSQGNKCTLRGGSLITLVEL